MTIAGPSLCALAAAAIGRLLVQLDNGARAADYSRSGTLRDKVNGVVLMTANVITVEPPEVASRLTWYITHSSWTLTFMDRRSLSQDGTFVKSAPCVVSLGRDLLEAARFLDIPLELFLEALRADGCSHAERMIQILRWLNVPYARDPQSLRVVIQSL